MKGNTRFLWTLLPVFFAVHDMRAQSVEAYAGSTRAGIDVMWYKNFVDRAGTRTPFLYFSRQRASLDYRHSPTRFGSTNAISYNFKPGIGIVTVGSWVNSGFVPKAGIQYYRQSGAFLFFGWLVADLKKNGNMDLFGLFRYQPGMGPVWKGLVQLELFPVYTPGMGIWNLTERLRLGIKYRQLAVGFMGDFNQAGQTKLVNSENFGGFIRSEF